MADPVTAPVTDPAPSPSAPVVDPAIAADPAKAAIAADPVKPAAPEKYDFSAVKLADGKAFAVDPKLVDVVSPLFKEFGLSQENATKLVAAHAQYVTQHATETEAKRESDFSEWMKTNLANHQAQIRKEWGAEHDANVVVAQKGMARVFSAEAKKLLDDTGLGNHPEFLKAFLQVGKMVSEDKPPASGSPSGRKSNEAVFYGATTQ